MMGVRISTYADYVISHSRFKQSIQCMKVITIPSVLEFLVGIGLSILLTYFQFQRNAICLNGSASEKNNVIIRKSGAFSIACLMPLISAPSRISHK